MATGSRTARLDHHCIDDISLGGSIRYIEAYQACAEHLCALEDRCPHCGKIQPYLPRFPDIGICDHCRHPLAGTRPQVVVPRFQLWVAEALGGMVMRQTEQGFTPAIGRFRDFVREQVQALAAGNRAAFCRAVGFNDRGLNGWLNKGERPAVTQFLALCYGVKVMPTDIFAGSPPFTVGTELRSPPTKLNELPLKRVMLSDGFVWRGIIAYFVATCDFGLITSLNLPSTGYR